MAKSVLLDTGFWIALYEPRDPYYSEAQALIDMIEVHDILVPWPTLYETVNTRFTHRKERLNSFEKILRRHNTTLIDDTTYKDEALKLTFEYSKFQIKNYSLVDLILREILLDVDVKIDYLITFNKLDFHDICQKRKIQIMDSE